MRDLAAASLALMVLGLVLLAAVLYREGHFNQVSLPRWIGWRIDVDDLWDVWPADDADPAFEALVRDAMRTEVDRLDSYREER